LNAEFTEAAEGIHSGGPQGRRPVGLSDLRVSAPPRESRHCEISFESPLNLS